MLLSFKYSAGDLACMAAVGGLTPTLQARSPALQGLINPRHSEHSEESSI